MVLWHSLPTSGSELLSGVDVDGDGGRRVRLSGACRSAWDDRGHLDGTWKPKRFVCTGALAWIVRPSVMCAPVAQPPHACEDMPCC